MLIAGRVRLLKTLRECPLLPSSLPCGLPLTNPMVNEVAELENGSSFQFLEGTAEGTTSCHE